MSESNDKLNILEWLKKTENKLKLFKYGLIGISVLLTVVAFILLFHAYSKLRFACNVGRRRQESCGLEYMEAETIRYEFHQMYNMGVLKQVKAAWILLMVAIMLSLCMYILDTFVLAVQRNSKISPEPNVSLNQTGDSSIGSSPRWLWLHVIFGMALMVLVIAATSKLASDGALKVMEDVHYGQLQPTDKQRMFGLLIGILVVVLLGIWSVTIWLLMTSKQHSALLSTVFYIGLMLLFMVPASIIVFSIHINLLNTNGSYGSAVNTLKNYLTAPLPTEVGTMITNYLTQNIKRLEPSRAELDGKIFPEDVYKFVEHKDSPTMFDMVSTNLVPFHIYESKWTEFLTTLTDQDPKNKLLLLMHVDRIFFTLLGGIPQSRQDYRFSKVDVSNYLQTRVEAWNTAFDTQPIVTNDTTMEGLPTLFTYRELSAWATDKAAIAAGGQSCDFGKCLSAPECNVHTFWMHFPIYVAYQWRSDLYSGLSFDKRTMDSRVRNLMLVHTDEHALCKQVRENVLAKMMSNVITTTASGSVDFNGLKTQLAVLRKKDEEILATMDKVRSMIIFIAIVTIVVPAYIVFHAIYRTFPELTTIVTIIAIMACIVAITWYGWFMGALAL